MSQQQTVELRVELNNEEALYLARLAKRLCWVDYRACAVDDMEARAMVHAVGRLLRALQDAGANQPLFEVSPREPFFGSMTFAEWADWLENIYRDYEPDEANEHVVSQVVSFGLARLAKELGYEAEAKRIFGAHNTRHREAVERRRHERQKKTEG